MLVATDREVVVIDVERGTSALTHGISDRPTCLAAIRWSAGVRGVALTVPECSGVITAVDPGSQSASRAG